MNTPKKDLKGIKTRAAAKLLPIPGVQGIGLGDNSLRVYVLNEKAKKQIPESFEGTRIEVIKTGQIVPALLS